MRIVLIRDADFPLLMEFPQAPTAGISADVGLHLQCKISDANEFLRTELVDRKFVSLERISSALEAPFRNVLEKILPSVSPEQIPGNTAFLEDMQNQLSAELARVFPCFQLVRVVRIESQREELDGIRKMKEELYVSELELTELTKRNAFLNKLNSEKNQQTLKEAKSTQEFERAMLEIDKEGMLTDDERARFVMMLSSQRAIREAALQGYRKSGLLRREELEVLESEVAQRRDLRNLGNQQIIEMTMLDNKLQRDRQQLLWEEEIGNRQQEIELERQRRQAAFEDERRRTEADLDHEDQLRQLDVLKQAQAVRQDRENPSVPAHRRNARHRPNAPTAAPTWSREASSVWNAEHRSRKRRKYNEYMCESPVRS